jgi:hypothetical protein
MTELQTKLVEIWQERDALRLQIEHLSAQIAALDRQALAILNGTVRTGGVPLLFEADGLTIRWDGGSIRLGKKPFYHTG